MKDFFCHWHKIWALCLLLCAAFASLVLAEIDSDVGPSESSHVYYIQNAHANIPVQKNIQTLLETFRTKGLDAVYLEGYVGEPDLTLLRSFPLLDEKKEIIDRYVDEGRINGAESFILNDNSGVRVFGLEDKELYVENVRAYVSYITEKERYLQVFEQVKAKGLQLFLRSSSKDMLDFFYKMREKKIDGQHKLYYDELLKTANSFALPLSENLSIYADLNKYHKKETLILIAEQADQIKECLISSSDLNMQKMALLEMDCSAGRLEKSDFYLELRDVYRSTESVFKQGAFTEFKQYCIAYELFKKMDSKKIIAEAGLMYREILKRFSDLDEADKLLRFTDAMDTAERLLSLKAYPGDIFSEGLVTRLISRRDFNEDFPELAAQLEKENDLLSVFSRGITQAMEFYKLAQMREQAFIRNMCMDIKTKGVRKAAVVTGGFHTSGMVRLLQDAGISFEVITPDCDFIEDTLLYEKTMLSYNRIFGIKEGIQGGTVELFSQIAKLPGIAENERLVKRLYEELLPEFVNVLIDRPDRDELLKAWNQNTTVIIASDDEFHRFDFVSVEDLKRAVEQKDVEWIIELLKDRKIGISFISEASKASKPLIAETSEVLGVTDNHDQYSNLPVLYYTGKNLNDLEDLDIERAVLFCNDYLGLSDELLEKFPVIVCRRMSFIPQRLRTYVETGNGVMLFGMELSKIAGFDVQPHADRKGVWIADIRVSVSSDGEFGRVFADGEYLREKNTSFFARVCCSLLERMRSFTRDGKDVLFKADEKYIFDSVRSFFGLESRFDGTCGARYLKMLHMPGPDLLDEENISSEYYFSKETIDAFVSGDVSLLQKDVRDMFAGLKAVYGGKGAWLYILNLLKKTFPEKLSRIDIPQTAYISMSDFWSHFYDENNKIMTRLYVLAHKYKAGEEMLVSDVSKFNELFERLTLSKGLAESIKAKFRVDEYKTYIARSSGFFEDGYDHSHAGVFTSRKFSIKDDLAQVLFQVVKESLYTAYMPKTRDKDMELFFRRDNGIAFVVEPFLDYDVSSVSVSNISGFFAGESVLGASEAIVRPVGANTVHYKVNNGVITQTASFLDVPNAIVLSDRTLYRSFDYNSLRSILKPYANKSGSYSFLSEDTLTEMESVFSFLEDCLGVPVDSEWGVADGRVTVHQIRPYPKNGKSLVVKDCELSERESIARTPITVGQTEPEGVVAPVVVFSNDVSDKDVSRFEAEFGKAYVRIQYDVCTRLFNADTIASVLVDPILGSRLAHNIVNISDEIHAGKYTYLSGPVLREPLFNFTDFSPLADFDGIWISNNNARVFADLLEGVFYDEGESNESVNMQVDHDLEALYKRVVSFIRNKELGELTDAELDMLPKVLSFPLLPDSVENPVIVELESLVETDLWDGTVGGDESVEKPVSVIDDSAGGKFEANNRFLILYVDDDAGRSVDSFLKFGQTFDLHFEVDEKFQVIGNEEMVVCFVDNKDDALKVLSEYKCDYLITDWFLGRQEAKGILQAAINSGVEYADLNTGLGRNDSDILAMRYPGLKFSVGFKMEADFLKSRISGMISTGKKREMEPTDVTARLKMHYPTEFADPDTDGNYVINGLFRSAMAKDSSSAFIELAKILSSAGKSVGDLIDLNIGSIEASSKVVKGKPHSSALIIDYALLDHYGIDELVIDVEVIDFFERIFVVSKDEKKDVINVLSGVMPVENVTVINRDCEGIYDYKRLLGDEVLSYDKVMVLDAETTFCRKLRDLYADTNDDQIRIVRAATLNDSLLLARSIGSISDFFVYEKKSGQRFLTVDAIRGMQKVFLEFGSVNSIGSVWDEFCNRGVIETSFELNSNAAQRIFTEAA